jgi:hypothetical protein
MKINLKQASIVYTPKKLKDIPIYSFFLWEKILYVKMEEYSDNSITKCYKIFDSKIISFGDFRSDTIVEPCEIVNIEYCFTRN